MRAAYRRASLALLTILCATPALAGDWDTDTARLLGDPSFLPLGGQIEGVFAYTYQNDRYDAVNEENSLFPRSYRRDDNTFLPTLRYGITDDISVFADFGWGNNRVAETYVFRYRLRPRPTILQDKHVDFHSLGAQDPAFGATWRIIDQRSAPVSVDLTGSYTPDIFQARNASTIQTGTIAAGGQSGSVQAAISRETYILTLRAYAGFGYDGRTNLGTANGQGDSRNDAHAVYTAGLQSQLRPLPWFAINAGVNAAQAVRHDARSIEDGNTTPTTVEPAGSVSPYAGIVFPILNQHVVGELLYQHEFIDDGKTITDGDPSRTFHQQSNLYTARIYVAFGGTPAPLPRQQISDIPQTIPAPTPSRTYLVFFDWDRADLTTRARQIVAQAAEASTRTQTTRIEVDGYTDLSGTATYNQRLSIRRAQSVQSELVRDGVNANDITIHGYGETNPLIQTAKGVREPQNRRVEIILK